MATTTEAPPLSSATAEPLSQAITNRVYARIGLLGNPSDGFYGKTISFSLQNFHAEVQNFKALTICVPEAHPVMHKVPSHPGYTHPKSKQYSSNNSAPPAP
jgi:hypothetical protein